MPTYEYECQSCGHAFERFQSMKDEPLKRCPICRCKVKRLLGTGAGIIFKGSGFHETDYRSDNYRQAADKDKSSTSPAATSDNDAGKSTTSTGDKDAGKSGSDSSSSKKKTTKK